MNKAHVFQEKYSGLQMFVYHAVNEFDAKQKLKSLVMASYNWIYIGQKIAEDAI